MTNEEEIKECTLSHMNSMDTYMGIDLGFRDTTAVTKMSSGTGYFMNNHRISNVRIFNKAIDPSWINLMYDELYNNHKPYYVEDNFPYNVNKTKDNIVSDSRFYYSKKYFDKRIEAETFRLTSLIKYYERKVHDTRRLSHSYKQGYKQKTYMFSFRDVSIMEKYITKYKTELSRLEIDHPEWTI